MTNKKLKPGAVQDGLLLKKYAEANGRLLFAAMVCLHRAGISRPALHEAWELYSKQGNYILARRYVVYLWAWSSR